MMAHEDECEFCAITKRVFGDRFGGCAGFANDLSIDTVKFIREKVDALKAELEQKHRCGDITKKDFEELSRITERSFAFVASNVPAIVTMHPEGGVDPATMVQLVSDNMKSMIVEVLRRSGFTNVTEMLGNIVRNNDPNLN